MEYRGITILLLAAIVSLASTASTPEPPLSLAIPPPLGGKYYFELWCPLSWYKALQFCRYHGMQLITINSKADHDKLAEVLNTTSYLGLEFWTAANDLNEKNQYTWYSTGANMQYSNFKQGEPNHGVYDGEMERCIEMKVEGGKEGVKWNDIRCSKQLYFICEK